MMLTPSATAHRKAADFSTPNFSDAGSAPELSPDPQPHWRNPSPVIAQRRARTARHARVVKVFARISILLMADILVLIVAYDVLHFLRSQQAPSAQIAQLLLDISPRGIFPRGQVLAAVIAGLAIFRNYGSGPARRHSRRLVAGSTLGLSLVFWAHIWNGMSAASLLGFVLGLSGLALLLIAGRKILDRLLRRVRPTAAPIGRALAIGSRARAEVLLRSDAVRKASLLDLVGFVSLGRSAEPESLGKLSDLVWLLERHDIDTLILAQHVDDDTLVDILEIAHRTGCATLTASPLYPIGGFIPRVVQRGQVPYIEIKRPHLDDAQLLMKRVFDIAAAATMIAVLSPILAVVAITVFATTRGPVLFSQKRVGHCGRLFDMYKFRSMVHDAEMKRADLMNRSIYSDERLFKVKNDPRITRAGRLLRCTSIDELPQLWNVLRGDMSLVGPRPPLPSEVAKYEEHHYSRFDMRPGITGLWQVSGRSNITSFDKIVAMDTEYLSNWSLMNDLKILIRTVPAVLSMKGAV